MDNYLLEKKLYKDGCDIHYWVSNNVKGPWLIFLHGAGADHEMFNEQLQVLSENFKLLLWDARGHGQSRPLGDNFNIKLLVEDLIKIMAIEEIALATFIGQSMGGNIAQEMEFYYPDKVERLVLIDCSCNTMKLSSLEKFYLNITPFLLSLYPWNYLVNESVKASSVNLDVRDYLRKAFNRIGKNDFSKILLETVACLHYNESYIISKSILIVYGESDNTGNIKKIAKSWSSKEPNCELIMINDAGHCSNQDNPSAFNRVLIAFLNK